MNDIDEAIRKVTPKTAELLLNKFGTASDKQIDLLRMQTVRNIDDQSHYIAQKYWEQGIDSYNLQRL
jgi:hypothetical protein